MALQLRFAEEGEFSLQKGLESPSAAVLLSEKGVKGLSQPENTLALLVGQEVPVAATWAWLDKLRGHVDADDIVCLDTQLSTIYADQYAESGPKLRMLASSCVSEEMKLEAPVRPLEVPQFVAGIPAALLTHVSSDVRDRKEGHCWPNHIFTPMENQQQQRAAPVTRQFSTRFLSSDGIPEYNALLDTHLGKRREFLLGNRHSLELMQQTGVIERVETQPDNPNQYVVHIAEKPIHRRKRLPPRSGSGLLQLPESQAAPWRQGSTSRSILEGNVSNSANSLQRGSASTSRLHSEDNFTSIAGNPDNSANEAKKVNAATLKGLSRSYSSNTVLSSSCKPVLKSAAANRLALFGSTKCTALLESSGATGKFSFGKHRAASEISSTQTTEARPRSRSAVPAILAPSVDELKKNGTTRRSVTSTTAVSTPPPAVRGTVEHLLESDAAFMTQIRTMKEQLAELESTKAYLDTEIGSLRRKLRGVNAVRENDVAVAHCSSIMQHRLSKAEEEFMKLVTQQQEVKKDVDRVRRELLSLRKVRHKLQEDIEDVAQANQTFEEKIHAAKIVRNQLSEELSELERRAEVELEAQRLNLPPEDAVVVDVAKLMSAVQERNSARRDATVGLAETGSSSRALAILQSTASLTPPKDNMAKSHNGRRGSRTKHPKTLLDYCTAFRVLQHSMGFEDLAAFEQQFTATEEQLLSKYKANLALADEVAALEKELSAVNTEKKVNRANVRGIMEANEKMERDMQMRIQTAMSSIRSYNELREQRNREHAKLRGIMLRCLDALQIDVGSSELSEADGSGGSGGSSTNSSGAGSSSHSLYWTETQSPELLEMLQRKMTQVAVTLKVKHSSRMLEIPPEALRLNRGHDGRRSNMFSTREASKIVLGPREPSGSALAAILGTVQPPSVENAIALTENVSMMEVMHGLHRAVSPARRKASSLSIIPPEMGKIDASRSSSISTPPVVVALLNAGSGQVRRSKRNALSPAQGLSSRPSLAVMTEADRESDEGEEDDDDEVDDGHSENGNDGGGEPEGHEGEDDDGDDDEDALND
ncbi:unnamed protein product [Phytophthora lilii]|uniref:Unnamed protein product n=1 Tax=Phytophthora lilii TaxID=2077276 RepID=A0A9W6WMX0_9STRA|nr:unnamed protein product [Phytophthora lilii]